MNFTALDFETANFQRDACAVGAAVVRDGEVAEVFSTLIQPPTLRFDKKCMEIHGIKAADVMKAPTFAEAWREVEKLIGDGPVAMHNAAFDVGVLVRNLQTCSIPLPDFNYLCTLELARIALPGLPNHRLPTLATVFGIPLEHHDAGSDAVACARLAILLTRLLDPREVGMCLREAARYAARQAVDEMVNGATVRISLDEMGVEGSGKCDSDAIIAYSPAPDGRFEGLRFVFTGELSFLTRAEATRIVEDHGGKVSGSVSSKTTYVVVGEEVWAARKRGGKATAKLMTALELQEKGSKIRIVREPEFLKLCGCTLTEDRVENLASMVVDEEENLTHLRDL